MPYALEFEAAALQDVDRLLAQFPEPLQDRTLEQLMSRLELLAANPRSVRVPRSPRATPAITTPLLVGGMTLYVYITFRYSQDESAIIVTGCKPAVF